MNLYVLIADFAALLICVAILVYLYATRDHQR